jgi:hypothetical protein
MENFINGEVPEEKLERYSGNSGAHVKGQNFAIFRIGTKYHTFAGVAGFETHMERKKETLNADPERMKYNRIIKGSPNITENLKEYLKDVKLRKNSVLATSMLLTASHSYFENMLPGQKEKWIQRNVKWLNDTFGEERILYVSVHEDERTTHMNVLFSARVYDQKKQCYKLCNRNFLGGTRERLQLLQDNYAKAMQPIGLVRGIRHSKATHVNIRTYYALLNKPLDIKDVQQVTAYAKEREALEYKLYDLKDTLDLYKRYMKGLEKDNISLAAKIKEVQKDKEVYGEAIKAMSIIYKIPQSSINQIISYAGNELSKDTGKQQELSK